MAQYVWTLLLARICELFPLLCPKCAGEIRIIAFLMEASTVREILEHFGEPTSPPPVALTRGPPRSEIADAQHGEFDPQAQPARDYEFAQRIAW